MTSMSPRCASTSRPPSVSPRTSTSTRASATTFSAALPGSEERYLIYPYGVHWSEMKPSDLLLIDGTGQVLEREGEVEATARNLHIAGHRANTRHLCILHTHMPWATSLTMIECGRLEMGYQTAARFHGRLAYDDDFGRLALNASECERIAHAGEGREHSDVILLAVNGGRLPGQRYGHRRASEQCACWTSQPALLRRRPARDGGMSGG